MRRCPRCCFPASVSLFPRINTLLRREAGSSCDHIRVAVSCINTLLEREAHHATVSALRYLRINALLRREARSSCDRVRVAARGAGAAHHLLRGRLLPTVLQRRSSPRGGQAQRNEVAQAQAEDEHDEDDVLVQHHQELPRGEEGRRPPDIRFVTKTTSNTCSGKASGKRVARAGMTQTAIFYFSESHTILL